MSVAIPRERCYYYECSAGRVRLTCFIPTEELEKLHVAGKIDARVLEDFPDGVDLDCTEPDFEDFRREYGYRPEQSADSLLNAFFAIYTSTKGWKSYRGTGLMLAADLEARVDEVERAVKEVAPEALETVPATPRLRQVRQGRLKRVLADMPVEGIVAEKPMDEQPFKRMRMGKGRRAQDVFWLLQQSEAKHPGEGDG